MKEKKDSDGKEKDEEEKKDGDGKEKDEEEKKDSDGKERNVEEKKDDDEKKKDEEKEEAENDGDGKVRNGLNTTTRWNWKEPIMTQQSGKGIWKEGSAYRGKA